MRLNQNYFLNHFVSTIVLITSMTDHMNYFMQKHYSLRKLHYHQKNMLLDTVELPPLMSSAGYHLSLLVSPFKPRTSSKWWAIVLAKHYPLVDGFQLLAFLISHSQLELFSADCEAFLMANFLACPTMPTSWNIFPNDAGNPRHPTSTG